ncbi:VOC family protein [Planococcus shenhongbingii]|uniref:VOC family protein n=1 Tax=Planococcus shenhongbingii TaxID=3058398 RepID=UPI0026381D91|nr:VOC family protein [Planococcus sp. N016]WKA58499.1 VOC family protein [Planococcus sp. N016]
MEVHSIQQIGQVGVPVKDLEKAVQFYQDVLELPLLFNTGSLAFFDCNGIRLLLSLLEKEEFAHSSSILYFNVEQIHEAYAEFKRKGVSFIDEPHMVAKMGHTETWMAFFHDTQGNIHALMSEIEAQ